MASVENQQSNPWLDTVLTRPWLTLLAFGSVFLVCLGLATQLQISQGLEFFLIKNDPDRVRNNEIKVDFSNDEIVILALDLGHPLNDQDLLHLAEWTDRIESIEGVEDVLTLTSVEDIRADGDFLDTSSFFKPDLVGDGAAFQSLVERLQDHPLFEGNLISKDLDSVAVLIQPKLEDGKTSGLINRGIIHALEEMLPDLPYDAYLGGYPAAEVDSTRIATRDLIVLTGAAFALILTLAFLLLRHWLALLMIASLAGFSQLFAIATLVLIDAPFTSVTATLPTILLATTSAYAIYAFSLLKQRRVDSERPGVDLALELVRPCVVSAVSTAAGFLALLTTPILAIQHLGIGLAVGILACLAGALLMLPALIEILKNQLPEVSTVDSPSADPAPKPSGFSYGVELARRPWLMLAIAASILLASILGLSRLRIESDPISYWKKDSFHRISDSYLQQEYDGSLFINVILTTGEVEGALRPDVLEFARKLIEFGLKNEIVSDSLSLLDYLQLLDDALNVPAVGDAESQSTAVATEDRRYFSSEGLASQYMLLYENSGNPEDFEDFIDFDRRALNIFLKVNSRSSTAVLELRDSLLATAENRFFWARPEDTDGGSSGYLVVVSQGDGRNLTLHGQRTCSRLLWRSSYS